MELIKPITLSFDNNKLEIKKDCFLLDTYSNGNIRIKNQDGSLLFTVIGLACTLKFDPVFEFKKGDILELDVSDIDNNRGLINPRRELGIKLYFDKNIV